MMRIAFVSMALALSMLVGCAGNNDKNFTDKVFDAFVAQSNGYVRDVRPRFDVAHPGPQDRLNLVVVYQRNMSSFVKQLDKILASSRHINKGLVAHAKAVRDRAAEVESLMNKMIDTGWVNENEAQRMQMLLMRVGEAQEAFETYTKKIGTY